MTSQDASEKEDKSLNTMSSDTPKERGVEKEEKSFEMANQHVDSSQDLSREDGGDYQNDAYSQETHFSCQNQERDEKKGDKPLSAAGKIFHTLKMFFLVIGLFTGFAFRVLRSAWGMLFLGGFLTLISIFILVEFFSQNALEHKKNSESVALHEEPLPDAENDEDEEKDLTDTTFQTQMRDLIQQGQSVEKKIADSANLLGLRQAVMTAFLMLRQDMLAGLALDRSSDRFRKALEALIKEPAKRGASLKVLQKIGKDNVWPLMLLIERFNEADFAPAPPQRATQSRIFQFLSRFLNIKRNESPRTQQWRKAQEAGTFVSKGHINNAYQILQKMKTPTSLTGQAWLRAANRFLTLTKHLDALEIEIKKILSGNSLM